MYMNPTSNLFSVLRRINSCHQEHKLIQNVTRCKYTGCNTALNMPEVRTFSDKMLSLFILSRIYKLSSKCLHYRNDAFQHGARAIPNGVFHSKHKGTNTCERSVYSSASYSGVSRSECWTGDRPSRAFL
jgi:hypothetical protein